MNGKHTMPTHSAWAIKLDKRDLVVFAESKSTIYRGISEDLGRFCRQASDAWTTPEISERLLDLILASTQTLTISAPTRPSGLFPRV